MKKAIILLLVVGLVLIVSGCTSTSDTKYAIEHICEYTNTDAGNVTIDSVSITPLGSETLYNYTFTSSGKPGYVTVCVSNGRWGRNGVIALEWPTDE